MERRDRHARLAGSRQRSVIATGVPTEHHTKETSTTTRSGVLTGTCALYSRTPPVTPAEASFHRTGQLRISAHPGTIFRTPSALTTPHG